MRGVEEKEAIASLSIWGLICVFDFAAVWPELDGSSGRWSGAGALAVFVAVAVLLVVQCLQPLARDAPRLLLKRPMTLAAHMMMVSGCAVWLTVHVAIGDCTPQVCSGTVALWALLCLSIVRACPSAVQQPSSSQSDCTTSCQCATGDAPCHTMKEVVVIDPSAKEIVRPADRVQPLPPLASPVPLPTTGSEDKRQPLYKKSRTMGASLKDLFTGPWQFKEAGGSFADDECATIIARVKKGSNKRESVDDLETDPTSAPTVPLDVEPPIDAKLETPEEEATTHHTDDDKMECKDTIRELAEFTEKSFHHLPKQQGIGVSSVVETASSIRRISLPIPMSYSHSLPTVKKRSSILTTVTPPPMLHLEESGNAQTDVAEKLKEVNRTAEQSTSDSPETRRSNQLSNLVEEPSGLKTPDEEEIQEKQAAEGHTATDDAVLIEAESLRKAVLKNLCRRPAKMGDPISGARTEEIHEILFSSDDHAWLSSSELNWSAFEAYGDPEDLDNRRPSAPDLPSDMKIDGNMGNDDFQRLREQFSAMEAGKSANKSPSLWPMLVMNSICGSNMSRRASYLPGMSGQAMDFNSRKNSAVGSFRNSRRASRLVSAKDSIPGSRLGSAQGSRVASRSNSFCVPEAESTRASRRASRANTTGSALLDTQKALLEERESTTSTAVTSRRASQSAHTSVAPSHRNSLMLPSGAQLRLADADEDDDDIEEAPDDTAVNISNTGVEAKNRGRRVTAPTLTMTVPEATTVKRLKTQPSLAITEESRGSITTHGSGFSEDEQTPSAKVDAKVTGEANLAINGDVRQSFVIPEVRQSLVIPEVRQSLVIPEVRESLVIPAVPSFRSPIPSEEESKSDHGRDGPLGSTSDEVSVVDDGTDKLRAALASQPQMSLKDLLLSDGGFGDLSVESLLRVAGDLTCKEEKAEKGSEVESMSSDDDSSGFDDDEDHFDELDAHVAAQLQGLNMDPSVVSEALKMLMLLNDGFKAKNCTCKDGGPHTCMSPAVSQLASQVHTTLQSLNQSMAGSKAVSTVGSRRASIEKGNVHHHHRPRRRSSKESGPKGNRSSQPTVDFTTELEGSLPGTVPPPPPATVTRSSLLGSRGSRLRPGSIHFGNVTNVITNTSFGPADVGAGPSSLSPTDQVDA